MYMIHILYNTRLTIMQTNHHYVFVGNRTPGLTLYVSSHIIFLSGWTLHNHSRRYQFPLWFLMHRHWGPVRPINLPSSHERQGWSWDSDSPPRCLTALRSVAPSLSALAFSPPCFSPSTHYLLIFYTIYQSFVYCLPVPMKAPQV